MGGCVVANVGVSPANVIHYMEYNCLAGHAYPHRNFGRVRFTRSVIGAEEDDGGRMARGMGRRRRVFFLDVYPLCYKGNEPRPSAFINWIRLLFTRVTDKDPIIAVMDGERGNEYRRRLLPTYKSNRNRFTPLTSVPPRHFSRSNNVNMHDAFQYIEASLWECNVPVVKVEDAEADDVVATLVDQVLQRGLQTVIASPDKDFKQLISENVQTVVPMPEFGRWSFYTLKHYLAQYNCDPSADLSLRSMMGDESDCIPGLAHMAPGFGRKTAVKLLKKHGSLENLLNAAAIRTVGKPYAQDALIKHANFLRRNFQVLSLRRDVPVNLKEEWCCTRDTCHDIAALTKLEGKLKELQQFQARKWFVYFHQMQIRKLKLARYRVHFVESSGPCLTYPFGL